MKTTSADKKIATNTTFEIEISDRTWHSQQTWHRERVVMNRGHRLRLSVRRNAYEFQSWAKAEVWEGAWIEVHSIAGEQLFNKVGAYDKDVRPIDFDEDINELRRVAMLVLPGKAS